MGGRNNLRHGHTTMVYRSPTYISWQQMKARCYQPTAAGYSFYGGRGISLCDRWRFSFKNFLADMGERQENHSLDRANPNGNYEPGNCRWATGIEQGLNRSSVIMINGKCAAHWSIELGGCPTLVRSRLKDGWSIEKAISTPAKKYKKKDSYNTKQVEP